MTVRPIVDVAVVGAGVVGASVARAAVRAGMSVTVVDGGSATGPRASDVPVALVNPWRGRKGDAHPDDLLGAATTYAWSEQLATEGHGPALHRTGVLRIAVDARQATSWRHRCSERDDLTWLDSASVPHPYVAPYGAMRVNRGGWLDAHAWTATLMASARRFGAAVVEGDVVSIVTAPGAKGSSWRLTTKRPATKTGHRIDDARNDTIQATWVVLCTGARSLGDVDFGGAVPRSSLPGWVLHGGHLAALRPENGVRLPLPFAGSVYGASQGSVTWIGGGHVDVTWSNATRPTWTSSTADLEGLRRAASHTIPALADARITSSWSGVRARGSDGRPAWIALAPRLAALGGFAGRGFLAAALEAERAVERLLGTIRD